MQPHAPTSCPNDDDANEQTPLLAATNHDLSVATADGGRSQAPTRSSTAGIAVAAVVAAAAAVIVFLAIANSPSFSLSNIRLPPASSSVDILQWSVIIGSFILSVASYHMGRVNEHALRQYSTIVPDNSSHADTKLISMQQRTMLSLAITVCNYADLLMLCNECIRRHKHLNSYAFMFSALKVATNKMLEGWNEAFAIGLTNEITNSHPEAKEQFTLYSANLLDAANHDKFDKWGKRDIIEGNERLLVQIMSYLTSNNDSIGGEAAVNPVLNRIDGLLDVHLRLLENHQS